MSFPFPAPVACMAIRKGGIAAVRVAVRGNVIPPDRPIWTHGDQFRPPRISEGEPAAIDQFFVFFRKDENPAWTRCGQRGVLAGHLWERVEDIYTCPGLGTTIEMDVR